jgi:hypothetical protein
MTETTMILSQQFSEHPCVQSMHQITWDISIYLQHHDLRYPDCLAYEGKRALTKLQEMEQTAQRLVETIQTWGLHIDNSFTFLQEAEIWRQAILQATGHLESYPTFLSLGEDYQRCIDLQEQKIHASMAEVFDGLRIVRAWLVKWENPIPRGFRLQLAGEQAPPSEQRRKEEENNDF